MAGSTCTVCGGTESTLVDGFYYCAECGTQDENVRETIVEHLGADGTYARTLTKKVFSRDVEMSLEWHKWHSFNFILAGMADELVAIGVSPTVKYKLLWIWAKYIKKYQVHEQDSQAMDLFDDEEPKKGNSEDEDEKIKGCDTITVTLLHAMLYIALGIENSDVHLAHLLRFIREYRISFFNVTKHIPKELKVSQIPKWVHFLVSRYTEGGSSAVKVKFDSEMLMKDLDLGKPNIPHMKPIIDKYVVELCLPSEFCNLVYSLMFKIPWKAVSQVILNACRFPNYGIWAMAYIVLGLKIAFGLDDVYENVLSDAVDKINDDNSHVKLFRFDDFSVDSTDRLFSFRDWLNFVRFRSMVLAKFYLPYAIQTTSDIDDYIFLMRWKEEFSKEPTGDISEAVTMDMLKKISTQISSEFRKCYIDFPATLTPLSEYTGIVASKINEPHLQAILTEDFSKYSIKYCTIDFNLEVDSTNIVVGADETNKFQQDKIVIEGILRTPYDKTMVFIRNCDNKKWLETRPPKLKHVSKVCEDEDSNDKSDQGYDSNLENNDNEFVKVGKCSSNDVPEECENNNIFDDDFDDIDTAYCVNRRRDATLNDSESNVKTEPEDILESHNGDFEQDSVAESFINKNDPEEYPGFDEATFNKEEAIKELVTAACRKYKIPLPPQYKDGVGKKRKAPTIKETTETKRSKRPDKVDAKAEVDKIIASYYARIIENAMLTELSNMSLKINDIPEQNDNDQNEPLDITEHPEQNDDPSVIMETDNQDNETLVEENITHTDDRKNDKFNENIYDLKQLYVKVKRLKLDNIEKEVSETVDKILTKDTDRDITEIPDDVIKLTKTAKRRRIDSEESEINTDRNIHHYGYWVRHYKKSSLWEARERSKKFNRELLDNFPASFYTVLTQCAYICESTTVELYTCFQLLEIEMAKFG